MDVLPCDCCSAEIKALFQEWIDCYGCVVCLPSLMRQHRLIQSNGVSNRENTLKTKEVTDKLVPLMEKCSLFSADAIEAPLELLHIWHYNPDEDGQVLKAANTDGKEEMKVSNGFHLDSKEPDWSKFRDFIMGEVRYNSLMKTFPQEAEELFVATERNAKLRYEGYKKLSEM